MGFYLLWCAFFAHHIFLETIVFIEKYILLVSQKETRRRQL